MTAISVKRMDQRWEVPQLTDGDILMTPDSGTIQNFTHAIWMIATRLFGKKIDSKLAVSASYYVECL